VDSSGRYTAPATAGTYHVIATSVADPSARDTASVTVGATGTPAALYGVASSTCAAMPVRTTGVTHYFCDCAAGAQAGCVAGSESNDGLKPSTPKQLLSTAVSTFNAMNGGDTVALCKGGGWSDSAGLRFNNPRCSGSASMRTAANTTTCDLRDYAPPWGGTAKPILRETGTGINLLQFWNTAGTSGVRILNLDLEGGGTGPGGTDVGTRAIASDSNNSNFLICNNTINGWNHGVHINNAVGASGWDVWGNRITNVSTEGILGATNNNKFDSNYFDMAGASSAGSHYVYIGVNTGTTMTNISFINNELRHTGSSACSGVMVVWHGPYDTINIENNIIDGGTNAAGGCYGLQLDDGGYPSGIYFRNLTVRRNLVQNVGVVSIAVAEAPSAVIENNIISATFSGSYGIFAPSKAHRTSPLDDTMTNAVIRNNTLYFTARGTGIYSAYEGTNYVIANNAIAFAATNGSCFSFGLPVAAYAYENHNLCNGFQNWEQTRGTLAAWQTYSGGFDAASLTSAPQFENPPTGFVPAAGSPLLGNGDTAQAPAYDFALRLRPNPVSVGALER